VFVIITRTPYRISFFGGGTDYPAWFREHGGSVLSTTINRYCHITCRFLPPFFDFKSRVVWSHIELVRDHRDVLHPVVRALLEALQIEQGVELHHNGDLPAQSGLGSSSSFTVGCLHALLALQGHLVGKRELADRAVHVEQEILKENVGIQDQIAASFGGLNRIEIARDGTYAVQPIPIDPLRLAEFERHLILLYTGQSRRASAIAAEQIRNTPNKTRELTLMREMVDPAVTVLTGQGPLDEFGRLIHESWEIKRSLASNIAPGFVNDIYGVARQHGALGGKLLGAGGGGFMLLFAKPESHGRIKEALASLLVVPIELERIGSQLLFYEPPTYSRTVRQGLREFNRFQTC
jgi:D-glycero-alpha-D-manno-heptose-7-phosphate kinase